MRSAVRHCFSIRRRSLRLSLNRFLDFAREHRGGALDERTLRDLKTADFRAFITKRRSEGLGVRGVRRAMSAIRSFFRHLAREEILENPAAKATRTPKLARTLPRPLSEKDAARTLEEAANNDVAWIALRDAALLTLLYGAGLRISEALALRRGDEPFGEWLTVLGKRNKERSVPVIPVMREAVAAYTAQLPFAVAPDGPLFVSRRGKAMSAREAQALGALMTEPAEARRLAANAYRQVLLTYDVPRVGERLDHAVCETVRRASSVRATG